jgi:hypothetical protein
MTCMGYSGTILIPRSPHGDFPRHLPTKSMYAVLVSPIPATCPADSILDFTVLTILDGLYNPQSFSLHNIINFPFTSSLPCTNTLLSTLFLKSCKLCCSFRGRDPVLKLDHTTGKLLHHRFCVLEFQKVNM